MKCLNVIINTQDEPIDLKALWFTAIKPQTTQTLFKKCCLRRNQYINWSFQQNWELHISKGTFWFTSTNASGKNRSEMSGYWF